MISRRGVPMKPELFGMLVTKEIEHFSLAVRQNVDRPISRSWNSVMVDIEAQAWADLSMHRHGGQHATSCLSNKGYTGHCEKRLTVGVKLLNEGTMMV
ncbi:hypothetical protein ALC53_08675 [Atta colombica]|uniref:Uncharacterized protein n=1 Tax=Atta colombica TaxID=520822 RepID=A0A151I2V6_9HYME|nr:hypothetical protein ALC53_08675 [Atta colombica]